MLGHLFIPLWSMFQRCLFPCVLCVRWYSLSDTPHISSSLDLSKIQSYSEPPSMKFASRACLRFRWDNDDRNAISSSFPRHFFYSLFHGASSIDGPGVSSDITQFVLKVAQLFQSNQSRYWKWYLVTRSPYPMLWLLVQIEDENRVGIWSQLECSDELLFFKRISTLWFIVHHGNGDCLSRLPLRNTEKETKVNEVKMINEMQIESLRPRLRVGHVGNVPIHYFPIIHIA